MAQQFINNGESGLNVRTKINSNFTELYTGKDAVTVNTYADLPAPSTVSGQRYWVLTSTGTFLINRRSKGAYYSDGTVWNYLGDIPTTADQIGNVPAGAIVATNVQAAINELDTDLTGVVSALPTDIRSQVESMLVEGASIDFAFSGSGASRQLTIAAIVAWADITGKPSTFPPSAKRVVTSGTTSGTQTPTSDTADIFIIAGLTGGITIAVPSGSPAQGQQLILRIIDNGTARSITWASGTNGYRAIGGNLPATTVIDKTLYVGCIYNSTDLRWDVIAVAQQA